MNIEEMIVEHNGKETIKIVKVNYYLNTKNDPNINFCLLLNDPHDLIKDAEERNKKHLGREGSSARNSVQSSINRLKKKKAMIFEDTDSEGNIKEKAKAKK